MKLDILTIMASAAIIKPILITITPIITLLFMIMYIVNEHKKKKLLKKILKELQK